MPPQKETTQSNPLPVEERWRLLLNSLGTVPICIPSKNLYRIITLHPGMVDINAARTPLVLLPAEIQAHILGSVNPVTLYNVMLSCKGLMRVVAYDRTLLYPNPRLTSNQARFEHRADRMGARGGGGGRYYYYFEAQCRDQNQVPLYVLRHSTKLPIRHRLIRQPRSSSLTLTTACYHCCETKQTPSGDHISQVGTLAWMRHIRADLARLMDQKQCTRAMIKYTAMELIIWLGDRILQQGGNLRKPGNRLNRNMTKTEMLEEALDRFRLWIDEIERTIDNNFKPSLLGSSPSSSPSSYPSSLSPYTV